MLVTLEIFIIRPLVFVLILLTDKKCYKNITQVDYNDPKLNNIITILITEKNTL